MATGFESKEDAYRNMQLSIRGFGSDVGTGTSSSAAVTVHDLIGRITTEALSTGEGAVATLTVTNDKVAAGDLVFVTVGLGTATEGLPVVASVKPADGSFVVLILNADAADDFNGTLIVSFMVVKALSGL